MYHPEGYLVHQKYMQITAKSCRVRQLHIVSFSITVSLSQWFAKSTILNYTRSERWTRFDQFLRSWFHQYRFSSVSTEMFLKFLQVELIDKYPILESHQPLDIRAWIDQPGIPERLGQWIECLFPPHCKRTYQIGRWALCKILVSCSSLQRSSTLIYRVGMWDRQPIWGGWYVWSNYLWSCSNIDFSSVGLSPLQATCQGGTSAPCERSFLCLQGLLSLFQICAIGISDQTRQRAPCSLHRFAREKRTLILWILPRIVALIAAEDSTT